MPAFCYAFQHIKRDAIEAVQRTVGAGFYQMTSPRRMEHLTALAGDLSEVYCLPVPKVHLEPRLLHSHGYYSWCSAPGICAPDETPPSVEATIVVRKASIITFLHEYRHHMQVSGVRYGRPAEWDAQAWATSLFRLACPGRFRQAVTAGAVMGLVMRDGRIEEGEWM